MNKETQQVFDYIEQSGFYLNKIDDIKAKYPNIKDFTLMVSYCIMEIVNTEKKFIHLNRKALELPKLAIKFF